MKHTITISKDGWVSHTVADSSIVGGYIEKGLGDIGVDVEIVDERLPSREAVEKAVAQSIVDDHVMLERTRILEEVEKKKMTNTKEEDTSDWFYGYGYNQAIDDIIKIIKGE
jgi:hypothetical protein